MNEFGEAPKPLLSDSEVAARALPGESWEIARERLERQFNETADPKPLLSDSEVAARSLPGEGWEMTRERLELQYSESAGQGALSELEWERLVDLPGEIQRHCINILRHGREANTLFSKALNLFEYSRALADGRAVELIPREGHVDGPLDEAYMLLSRLSPQEAEGIPYSLIGLIDVLGHPEPYDNLQSLEEDGVLNMVLLG